MSILLWKYRKYDVEYFSETKELVLYKPIGVREFLELKRDISLYGADVKNIVVTNRYLVAKTQF